MTVTVTVLLTVTVAALDDTAKAAVVVVDLITDVVGVTVVVEMATVLFDVEVAANDGVTVLLGPAELVALILDIVPTLDAPGIFRYTLILQEPPQTAVLSPVQGFEHPVPGTIVAAFPQ